MSPLARRIAWLIGIYSVLAVAPLLNLLFPLDTTTLPILWATFALPLSGLLILSLWAGIGNNRWAWRLLALATGCAYLAFWSAIAQRRIFPIEEHVLVQYVRTFVPYVVVAALIGGMFAIMRRRFHFADRAPDESANKPGRLQFSVFHLLVLMSFVAVTLSLMRGARGEDAADAGVGSWQWWAAHGLFVVTFFAGTACAAYAALGPGNVVRNCVFVLIASASLGTAVAFSMRHDQLGPWHFAWGVLTMVLPILGVLASLLWLRPCGVRLVRRRQ
jgi:hypothetical protein